MIAHNFFVRCFLVGVPIWSVGLKNITLLVFRSINEEWGFLLNVMHFVPLQYDGPWFFYVINWVLALLSWWTFAVWRWWCFGFFLARLLNPFSSGCDAFRTAPVWWTLFFMALADFNSVKKKCLLSGGHLFWLPVANMIQSKCSFECDAIRTAPVWLTMIFMTSAEF